MLTDQDLTELIRAYSSFPKDKLTASFYESKGLECRVTRGGFANGKMEIRFPDYLRNAPCSVIIDLSKKIMQKKLYDSDYEISQESKNWLISEMKRPEIIRIYNERNGYEPMSMYCDAFVVSSYMDDRVDYSIFFNVIRVPQRLACSPDSERYIASAYRRMVAERESFLEA